MEYGNRCVDKHKFNSIIPNMAYPDRPRTSIAPFGLHDNGGRIRPYDGPLEDLVPHYLTKEGGFVRVSFKKTAGDCATFRANLLRLPGRQHNTLVVRRMSDGLHSKVLGGDVQERLLNAAGEERETLVRNIRDVGTETRRLLTAYEFREKVIDLVSRF